MRVSEIQVAKQKIEELVIIKTCLKKESTTIADKNMYKLIVPNHFF